MEKRRGILFLFFLVVGIFAFSADFSFAAGPTDVYLTTITEPTTWTKANSPYILHYKLTVKAKLMIEPGTVVKFASSATGIEMLAEISAIGTKKEKIVFTSIHDDSVGGNSDAGSERAPLRGDWDKINASPNYAAKFENVVVSYATTGIMSQSTVSQYENLEIKNSEIKNNVTGIDILNLSPVIESNVISNNSTGISTKLNASYPERTTTVRYNSFSGNSTGIFTSNTFALKPPTVDAKHNWWGSDTGPYNNLKNKDGSGDSVSDYWIAFDPWLKADPNVGLDPVIIIPGIMGSWEVDGKWKIDPIFHTYDNLCEEFLANGYEDGKNFSVFPYEWRNSNVDNAKLLRDRINQIKTDTGRPKVDIVAHSMGGLLAREYIESDYFADDVDQLITVGTPHLGSPEAYMKWEGGAWLYNFYEIIGRSIFDHEAQENNFNDAYSYIRNRPIISVKELLPIYNYLYDIKNNYSLREKYPTDYPRNNFLENLNKQENVQKLKNVEFTKIIGKTNNIEGTLSGYNVVDSSINDFWEHGVPKDFYNPLFVDNGLRNSDGDETVPLYSAESSEINADKTMYLQSKHGNLPTDAQKDILEILTGKRPTNEVTKWHIPNLLLIDVHSPVDIQVVSPSGEKIGKNFETGGTYDEIDGAYYSGFDTNTEFLTIPNPEDGEYQILTEGTGTGEYMIEATKITEDPSDPDNAKESAVTIEGDAEHGKVQEVEINVEQDQVVYNPDTTPPVISISSPEEIDYTNDKILTIDFNVEDVESGIASVDWKVEKDGENINWKEKSVDLSLEHLGNYILEVSASDKAGNSGEKEAKFQITTDFNAIRNNLDHYFDLGLVKKKNALKYFRNKIKNLGKLFYILEKTENSKLKPKAKEATVKAIKKVIDADIDKVIRQINRKSPRWINQEAADFLIEDLNAIKIK